MSQELISLLGQLDRSHYADGTSILRHGRLVRLIRAEAELRMILPNLTINTSLIKTIQDSGLARVEPGLVDDVGWISGVLITRKGVIDFWYTPRVQGDRHEQAHTTNAERPERNRR
jgi:hypothetical protein